MNKSSFFDFLFENAVSDSVALKMGKIQYTYDELIKTVSKIAKKMEETVPINNMKIGVSITNPIDFIIFTLAIILNQGIVIPIYDKMGEMKLKSFLETYNINIYVSLNECIGRNKTQICLNSKNYTISELSSEIDLQLEDVALMMLTSGTTNLPKLAMLTVDNIFSNINGISDYLALTSNDRILIVKSYYHISTLVGEIMVGFHNSCSLIFSVSLPTSKFLYRILNQENITVFFAVASLLTGLLDSKIIIKNKIRILNFYGSTFPASKMESLFNAFPDTDIIYSYGLTEASPRVTYIHKDELLQRIGSSGKTMQGIRLEIHNEQGVSQNPGQIGEIVVDGPNVFKGYYMNYKQTSRTLRNGLLYTGDLGYLDDDGYLYVTGRKDNMVIISGKNVFPEEIESIINQYPGISEALVCKRGTSDLSPKLTAFIVECPNSPVNISGLLQHCRLYLEDYKIPSEIIAVKQLNKTISGKIMRFDIGDWAGL